MKRFLAACSTTGRLALTLSGTQASQTCRGVLHALRCSLPCSSVYAYVDTRLAIRFPASICS
jgi:hypothetical protein